MRRAKEPLGDQVSNAFRINIPLTRGLLPCLLPSGISNLDLRHRLPTIFILVIPIHNDMIDQLVLETVFL